MTGPLIDDAGRVRDLAREARDRRVRIAGRVVAGLTAAAVLGWAAMVSPLFAARSVQVTGNKAIASEAIVKAAQVPLGQPLAGLDTAAIGQRVGSLPGVARGDVSVGLPDVVTIKVTERTVAYAVQADGVYKWVDPTGQVFGQSKEKPKGVPIAQLKKLDDHAVLAEVASVANALPARLAGKLRHIAAGSRDSIELTTTEGSKIVWGSAERAAVKGQIADTLSQASPKCHLIDVSSPTHPTTKC